MHEAAVDRITKMISMKMRYKFWVWALCLVFPTLVWAESAARMHFFTTRPSGDFSPDGQCCVAVTALQSFGSQSLVFRPMDNCNENASFAVINEELEDVGTVHVDEQAACYEIFTPKL